MAKQKELLPVNELYQETISLYDFDSLVLLHRTLTTRITNDGKLKKEEGEKAAKVLESLNGSK